MPVFAFSEEMQVILRQLWHETVRVMERMLNPMGITPRQAVAIRNLSCITMPFKQVGVPDSFQLCACLDDPHPGSTRNEGSHQFPVGNTVFSEYRERIMMPRLQQTLHFSRKFGRRGIGWVSL
jgi:hypothetical protein